jgi:hypothetical protein
MFLSLLNLLAWLAIIAAGVGLVLWLVVIVTQGLGEVAANIRKGLSPQPRPTFRQWWATASAQDKFIALVGIVLVGLITVGLVVMMVGVVLD